MVSFTRQSAPPACKPDDQSKPALTPQKRRATLIDIPTARPRVFEPHAPDTPDPESRIGAARRTSGRVKDIERSTRRPGELSLSSSGNGHHLDAGSATGGLSQTPRGLGLARRTGPRAAPRPEPSVFANTALAAKARMKRELCHETKGSGAMEIPSDHSSEDDVLSQGKVPRTPARSSARPGLMGGLSSVEAKINGFSSPYKEPAQRLESIRHSTHPHNTDASVDAAVSQSSPAPKVVDRLRPKRPNADPYADADSIFYKNISFGGASSSRRPIRAAEMYSGRPDAQGTTASKPFSSRTSREKMAEAYTDVLDGKAPSKPKSSHAAVDLQACSPTSFTRTASAALGSLLKPGSSNRRATMADTLPLTARQHIPGKTIDLYGVHIGRYFRTVHTLSSRSTHDRLRLKIKFVQGSFTIDGLGDSIYMTFTSADIESMQHHSNGVFAVLRIVPKGTMESVFDNSTFDPNSTDSSLKSILLCWSTKTPGHNVLLPRIISSFKNTIPTTPLDPSVFEQVVAEFCTPSSIDLVSSDEEKGAGGLRTLGSASNDRGVSTADPLRRSDTLGSAYNSGHKTTNPKSPYWSSVGNGTGSSGIGTRIISSPMQDDGSDDDKDCDWEPRSRIAAKDLADTTASANDSDRMGSGRASKYSLRRPTQRDTISGACSRKIDSDGLISSDEGEASVTLRHKYRRLGQTHLFEYPLGEPKRISVTGSDVCRLFSGEFLNDTVIEFYMRFISESLRTNDPELFSQCFFFNTFFFRKLSHLSKSTPASSAQDPITVACSRLKKWTTNVDLFDKKYIFVPINENIHWYLAIIINPRSMLETDCTSPASTQKDAPAITTPAFIIKSLSDPRAATVRSGTDTFTSGSTASTPLPDPVTQPALVDSTDAIRVDRPTSTPNLPLQQSPESSESPIAPNTVSSGNVGTSGGMAMQSSSIESGRIRDIIDLSSPCANRAASGRGASVAKDPVECESPYSATVSVEFMGKTLEIPETRYADPLKTTSILIMDSLGNMHPNTFRLLRGFLSSEAYTRYQIKSTKAPAGKYAKVPLQSNLCDCGVFVLHYIEKFLKSPQEATTLALNGITMRKWFEWEAVKQKRKDILALVARLSEGNSGTEKATLPKPSDSIDGETGSALPPAESESADTQGGGENDNEKSVPDPLDTGTTADSGVANS
ncbi:hypothetical protein GGI07_005296 [Coemansia sp. Benny D115]|nr:hypothetical protein GGI07_005296 [Coemansia sp. Benny D115]